MNRAALARVRLGLSIVGLVIATYLSALHYFTQVPLVCSATGIVDCAAVLTSPQSVILGIPVALFGFVWFLGNTILSARGLRPNMAAGGLRTAQTVWTAIGALTVVYLVYLELLVIGRICLWCSGVHLIVLTLLVLQVLLDRSADPAATRAQE